MPKAQKSAYSSLILPRRLRSEMASKNLEINKLQFEIETFLESIESDRATSSVPQLKEKLESVHLLLKKYPNVMIWRGAARPRKPYFYGVSKFKDLLGMV